MFSYVSFGARRNARTGFPTARVVRINQQTAGSRQAEWCVLLLSELTTRRRQAEWCILLILLL